MMLRCGALAGATLLAACGGFGSRAVVGPEQTSALPAAAIGARRPSQRSCLVRSCIYISEGLATYRPRFKTGIFIYPEDANGDIVPMETIHGRLTGFRYPYGIAVDAQRTVYTTNFLDSTVTVYAPGDYGIAEPIRLIKGAATGLLYPWGIALDSSKNIYVANYRHLGIGSVLVFAAGATGNVAPIQRIKGPKTGLRTPQGVAVDGGGSIYVANFLGNSITVYARGANGDVAPVRTIAGTNTGLAWPAGVTLDFRGNLYVANVQPNSILVFAPGANGNVAPIRAISGPDTLLSSPVAIALDQRRNIYIVEQTDPGSGYSYGTLRVYAAGSNGDAAPLRSVIGSQTTERGFWGIAVR